MTAPARPGPAARALLVLVRGYQRVLSPLLGPHCRFAPSCSAYAVEALSVHGAWRGSGLALRRVLRCHPFHPGGHDPVPRAAPTSATMGVGPPLPRTGQPGTTQPGTTQPGTTPPGTTQPGTTPAPTRRPARPGPGS